MKHSREQPVCGGLQPRQKRVYLCTLGAATFVVWGKAGNVAHYPRPELLQLPCPLQNTPVVVYGIRTAIVGMAKGYPH